MPFVRREQTWGDAPAAPAADRLVVKATNVATAVVDARRARLSCAPGWTSPRRPARPPDRLRAAEGRALREDRGAEAAARAGRAQRRGLRRARQAGARHNLRWAVIRRPSGGAFTVRMRVRTSGGRTIAVHRRVAACH